MSDSKFFIFLKHSESNVFVGAPSNTLEQGSAGDAEPLGQYHQTAKAYAILIC